MGKLQQLRKRAKQIIQLDHQYYRNVPSDPAPKSSNYVYKLPQIKDSQREEPIQTLEQVLSIYYTLKDEWLGSQERADVIEILKPNKPNKGWGIREAVVIGIGEFCDPVVVRDRGREQNQRCDLMQLAGFLDIVDNRESSNTVQFLS